MNHFEACNLIADGKLLCPDCGVRLCYGSSLDLDYSFYCTECSTGYEATDLSKHVAHCPDCGVAGEREGHRNCQYPS